MQKNNASQFGISNPRVLLALSLCSVAASLMIFSFAATPGPYNRPGVLQKLLASGAGSTNSVVPVAASADGRYLGFNGAFPFGCCVVGIYDRQTGVTSAPVVSDLNDGILSFSADGRYLAFATNGYDSNGAEDVYLYDQQTGKLTWLSVAPGGSPPSCDFGGCVFSSWYPSISGDGRYVAFQSFATNLVPGDTNQKADVFVRDTQTGITERVSVASDGTQANGDSAEPSISADGRFVAFRSFATNLVSGNSNTVNCAVTTGQTNPSDIYIHDRQTGVTELVSVGIGGTQDGCSWGPSISSDGRYVAFTSAATTLIPVDSNGAWDVFVRDRQTGRTQRVSVSSDGVEGICTGCSIKNSVNPSITPDGRYVTFTSGASNLVPGDTNNDPDIFVHDRETGATERVSVATDGTQGNSTSGTFVVNAGLGPAISGDGRIIVFDSKASNWVPGDPTPKSYTDVFMRDRGPTIGIGALSTSCSANPATASGWATFSGGVISRVDDPSNDASQGATNVGGELIGASLAYRPEHADLFVRFSVSSLPSKGPAPGVLYGFKLTIGTTPYEVRAAQGENMGSPLFALYNCQSAPAPCTQVATLAGGMGTTGNEITVSVPLSALGATEGTSLTGLDAYTAIGSATAGPAVTLDDDPLPPMPTTIPVHSVTLGIAPSGTPEANVSFNTPATLANGMFSGSLPPAAAGSYDVWARACLGATCGKAASVPLTVTQACAAPPVQLLSIVSVKTHGSAGTLTVPLQMDATTRPRGVECRSGGANNSHTILFTFQNNLVGTIGTDPANANVVTGPGSVVPATGGSGSTGIGPLQNQYTVNLQGVTDANYVTVALHSVSDTAGNVGDVATTMGVLLGDVTGNGVVTNTDVSAVKGVVDPTTLVTQANCRYDVTVNGFVTNTDVSVVKGQVNPTGGIPTP